MKGDVDFGLRPRMMRAFVGPAVSNGNKRIDYLAVI